MSVNDWGYGMESKSNRRSRNGRNWARTGLLAGVAVAVLLVAFGGGIEYRAMIAVGALLVLPLLGWFIGLSIPEGD